MKRGLPTIMDFSTNRVYLSLFC